MTKLRHRVGKPNENITTNSATVQTINVNVPVNVTIHDNRSDTDQNILPNATSLSATQPADNGNQLGYSQFVFWFCFAYFAFLATIMYLFSSGKSSERKEPFCAGHTLAASTAITAACYFFMAIGEGQLYEVYAVQVADGITTAPGNLLYRRMQPPVIWIRHVDWAISTSIALFLLTLLAGTPRRPGPGARAVPVPFTATAVGLNLCVHVLGLTGTLVPHVELSKWTYWVLGLLLYAALLRHLTGARAALARAAARNRRANEVRNVLRFVCCVWSAYPVLWAIGDGRLPPPPPPNPPIHSTFQTR